MRQKRTGARLGQHFLKHGWAARALARAASVRPGETILEIGPGKGILTRELLKEGAVLAIEKDEALAEKLRETFAAEIADGRLRLIEGDIRDFDPAQVKGDYVVAANIPYYITGEIIRQFLTAAHQPRALALLVQKEVAKRIIDTKGSLLSLSVKAYGTPRLVEKVPRKHFSPPPSVDSAIILIDDISNAFFSGITEEQFFAILHAGFAQKRKMLMGNLVGHYDKGIVVDAFAAAQVPEKARAEEVSLEQWGKLAKKLLRGS